MPFTDDLRDAHRDAWARAAGHRFTTALLDGTLPDAVMARCWDLFGRAVQLEEAFFDEAFEDR